MEGRNFGQSREVGGIGGGREEVGEEGWSTEEDGVRR